MSTIRPRPRWKLQKQWTDEEKADVLELRKQGISAIDIAAKYNVTKSSIYSIVHISKKGNSYKEKPRRVRGQNPERQSIKGGAMSWDHALVEPWADYTKRKQKERADAREAARQRSGSPEDAGQGD